MDIPALKIKLFFLLGFIGISFIVIAYFSFEHVNLRINNFLFTDNLQVTKSLSAIKEGGLFGVGLGEGQLKYSIPESHNDFIFAILVEEFGLLFGLISFEVTNTDASEWNQWRGNLRDGSHKSPIPWPESIDKDKLSETWTSQDIGASYSGPITNGELIFTTEST